MKTRSILFTYNPNDRVNTLNDTVLLRNMTIAGEWGQINVGKSVVRLNNWTAFYLLPPQKITGNTVEGDDYKIQLTTGWQIVEENGIYKLKKV